MNAPVIAAERGIEVSSSATRPRTTTRTSCARGGGGRRRGERGLGDDRRARAPPLPRRGARFRHRHRARAEDGVPGLRRHARRHRTRRHDVRRGGRQHREHGGLAHEGGREGADGVLDRLSGPAGPRRARRASPASTTPASSRSAEARFAQGPGRLRRGRPGRSRSSGCLPSSASRGRGARIEQFPDGTPTAADAAAAVGCGLDQIVKSLVLVCDDRPWSRSCRATAAGTRRRSRELGASSARIALGRGGREGDGLRAGRGRAVPLPGSTSCSSSARCSGTGSCGSEPARRITWSVSPRPSSAAGARQADGHRAGPPTPHDPLKDYDSANSKER